MREHDVTSSTHRYWDGQSGNIFVAKKGLVYRSLKRYSISDLPHREYMLSGIGWGWELFGITPQPQKLSLSDVPFNHPKDFVLDIDATFEMLRFNVIDDGLIENLRERKLIKK